MGNSTRRTTSTTTPQGSGASGARQGQRPQQQIAALRTRLRRAHMVNLVLVVIVLLLVVVIVAQQDRATTASAGASASPSGVLADQVARADADDPRAIGDIDAPVTIVEWTDLRCPYCASFANQTLPTLLTRYVETGQVRIEFHDVAYFGDESVDAAVAARAAGEQGRYVAYLETLYAAAPETGHPDMPREKLVGFAEQAGVPDISAFTAALDRDDLRQAVEDDTTAANSLGITGVPFFVIGDDTLSGAQSSDTFTKTIETQLQDAQDAA